MALFGGERGIGADGGGGAAGNGGEGAGEGGVDGGENSVGSGLKDPEVEGTGRGGLGGQVYGDF